MAQSARLVDLPPQVFQLLDAYLSLEDVCNLRLTSRDLSSKQSNFVSYLRSKTISLSNQECLRSFVSFTSPGQIGLFLLDLTVVGERSERSDESVALLTQAFLNISAHSREKGLQTLVLTIHHQTDLPAGIQPDNSAIWLTACASAIQTMRTAAEAVARSSLSIRRLSLFGLTELCAIPINLLDPVARFGAETLESLSLTIASRLDQDADPADDSAAECITRLCAPLSCLTHLEVRWFSLKCWQPSAAELHDRDFFTTIAHTTMLPRLTSVSIKGVYTTSDTLISFLDKHPGMRRLSLEEIHLTQGEYKPLFTYLDAYLGLELYLNDLWEKKLMQFPSTKGERRFPHSGAPTWFRRSASDRPVPISYRQMKEIIRASAAESNWRQDRALQYGPVS